MQVTLTKKKLKLLSLLSVVAFSLVLISSSHREAPMIAFDPLADNTDLYAFRNPHNHNKIVIIANYVPMQLPQAGPIYYSFGENVRYEIHIDNNINTKGDDIVYRFTFSKMNEDPTTDFYIRLGKQNQKTTYKLERSMDGGKSFTTVISKGMVPPYNVGPRSITSPVGLNAPDYNSLMKKSIMRASTGENVFAGTVDDPFFVDVGGIFDLGDAPRQHGMPRDGLQCKNVSTLALEVDITTLQKDHKADIQANNILDPEFVIGVWASASRRKIRVLNGDGTERHYGDWVQVSRIGMPLTNEAVVPIGYKDYWNSLTPYQDLEKLSVFGDFFYNPELALYMDDAKFGGAVPAFKPLRIQKNSLGMFGFGNGQNGLYGLKGTAAVTGTALDDAIFGTLLLPGPGKPRSVDIWPIFHTGVPNLAPYQLAVMKDGNPLAKGKPFVNNFLPNGGDMLRLNMAAPITPRDSKDFSPLGLVQAAVLGLTDPRFNTTKTLQTIPNMDGFPNGRRLEDDVTRIELQAVSGIALAAIGLWYDDFKMGESPVTKDLVNVLTYSTGVDHNDTTFKDAFPYEQTPWPGTHECNCGMDQSNHDGGMDMSTKVSNRVPISDLGLASPDIMATVSPNPMSSNNTVRYRLETPARVKIVVMDELGNAVKILADKKQAAGIYSVDWNPTSLPKGAYFINITKNGESKQSLRVVKQ